MWCLLSWRIWAWLGPSGTHSKAFMHGNLLIMSQGSRGLLRNELGCPKLWEQPCDPLAQTRWAAFFTRGGSARPMEQLGAEGAGQRLEGGWALAEAPWGWRRGAAGGSVWHLLVWLLVMSSSLSTKAARLAHELEFLECSFKCWPQPGPPPLPCGSLTTPGSPLSLNISLLQYLLHACCGDVCPWYTDPESRCSDGGRPCDPRESRSDSWPIWEEVSLVDFM